MKWLVAAAVVVVATGCAAQNRIRQIDGDAAGKCKYLGVAQSVDRSGWSMSDDQLGGMKEIRKRVSAMGGNAYVVTHGKRYSTGPVVQADVYRCR